MEKTIKQDWINALRSSEYNQGKGKFKREGAYCCLGVLCEIHPKITLSKIYEGLSYSAWQTEAESIGTLSVKELELVGLSNDIEQKLIGLNDKNNLTFNEIADWIEEHVLAA